MPFTFLLCLGVFSVGILWFVNVDKSRVECRRYLEEEAVRVYGMDGKEVKGGLGSGTSVGHVHVGAGGDADVVAGREESKL